MNSHAHAAMNALLERVGGERLVLWHRANGTELSDQEYQDLYRQRLFHGLANCKRFYLDTNYWIRLRDAERGTGSVEAQRLLKCLRAMVKSREAICVSHLSSFLELAQQEGSSLKLTAQLVDELSEGVAIAPPAELKALQSVEYVAAKLGVTAPGSSNCWTKIGQIVKAELPDRMPGPVSAGGRRVILKSTLDSLWNAGTHDVFGQFDWDTKAALCGDIDADVIERITELRASQHAQRVPRSQVRRDEFASILRSDYHVNFSDAVRSLWVHNSGDPNDERIVPCVESLVAQAIGDFASNSLGQLLPSLSIQTELYMLWWGDTRRPLTTNDWADWQHAAAALPYCDHFLTEKHLAHQLSNVMQVNQRFACSIAGSLEKAVEMCAHSKTA